METETQEAEKPNYYSITPAVVRYDQSLSGKEIALYGEISCLTNKDGYCWASNTYFAKLYGVHPRTVSMWVSNLKKAGHIRVEVAKKAGNNRKIWLNCIEGVSAKTGIPIRENMYTYTRKQRSNSISNIKTNNTSLPKAKEDKVVVQEKPFVSSEEIAKLITSERIDLKILGLYFRKKGYEFRNKEQLSIAIRRDIKAASDLKHFDADQLREAFDKTQKHAVEMKYDWKLSTVLKFIN